MTIFGVPWLELDLKHVESFLAQAGGEPLLWEAKGTDLPRPDSIAKHVCGFANAVDGGYMLLGFERVLRRPTPRARNSSGSPTRSASAEHVRRGPLKASDNERRAL